jgi:hypothetical protein
MNWRFTVCIAVSTVDYIGTVNSTSDYTLWTLSRSYFKGISANIELQVYSVTCC